MYNVYEFTANFYELVKKLARVYDKPIPNADLHLSSCSGAILHVLKCCETRLMGKKQKMSKRDAKKDQSVITVVTWVSSDC